MNSQNKVCIQREVGDVPVEVEVELAIDKVKVIGHLSPLTDEEFEILNKKLKKEVLLKLVGTVIDLNDTEFNKLHNIISVFTEETECNCRGCDCPMINVDVECVVCGYDGYDGVS